jgi:PAS domain-containing protein
MQLAWDKTSGRAFGPLVIAAIAVLAVLADHYLAILPNIAHLPASLVAAVLGIIATAAGFSLLSVHRTLDREQVRHAADERLADALNEIDLGVVLLDADTRAEFINQAFRKYFALPDEFADSKPPLIALMYHGRDTHAYQLPDDELDQFIAQRTEMIRAGDTRPIDIKLTNGRILRLNCAALPNGGRMLSYTPVTDLIRRGDDPAQRAYYLSLRGAAWPPRTRSDAAE